MKKFRNILFLTTILICKDAISSMGPYLLVGSTTKKFIDSKYVSFIDKNDREYKIPREILSPSQNSQVGTKSVVVYVSVEPEKYQVYRKACREYFLKEMKVENSRATKDLVKQINKECL